MAVSVSVPGGSVPAGMLISAIAPLSVPDPKFRLPAVRTTEPVGVGLKNGPLTPIETVMACAVVMVDRVEPSLPTVTVGAIRTVQL